MGKSKFQIGHCQNLFHLIPLQQICPFKKIEVGLQSPPLPQTPYMTYTIGFRKGYKLKI